MKRSALLLSALLSACASAPISYNPARRMVVNVPVADLRSKPQKHVGMYVQDPNQETQVLQGEPVLVKERNGKWARVECPLQPEYTHANAWEGYPGWIEAAFLTDDLKKEAPAPEARPAAALRADVLEHAARHLGNPYLWGGRSVHNPDYRRTVTGVDCSGLVNWSFRQAGVVVPRDAHEQFMKARRLEPADLKPGDLIFLSAAAKPERVVHVAFYIGNDRLLEAPQSGEAVREIGFKERFGASLNELSNGATLGERVIYFGTLFEDQ